MRLVADIGGGEVEGGGGGIGDEEGVTPDDGELNETPWDGTLRPENRGFDESIKELK